MDFEKLMSGQRYKTNVSGVEIKNIRKNSKEVKQGDVFFDLARDFEVGLKNSIESIDNGAAVVVSQHNYDLPCLCLVDDVNSTFAYACSNFYDNTASKLKIIGITGTNGKTTCAHLISEILRFSGKKVVSIGTMGVFYGDEFEELSMTTPDADRLHEIFQKAVEKNIEYAVMEVSAHAIFQKRIEGLKFEVGVLTNITQDHLDYFETMDKYAKTKLDFLTNKYVKTAVVNSDDKYGVGYLQDIKVPTVSFGLKNPADIFAVDINFVDNKSTFVVNMFDEVFDVVSNLVGEYNIENLLASILTTSILGVDIKTIKSAIKEINPVEGRFNIIKIDGKIVVVDFAHTPDGLEKVLATARQFYDKKLYCVFGCGGNRDIGKREKMGAIAEKYSDVVCLTNDNPRFENEATIVKDIERGMKKSHYVEFDREAAIRKMIKLASSGDVIVVAGKGGEKYQIVGDTKYQYSDFEVLRKIKENSQEIIKNENNT